MKTKIFKRYTLPAAALVAASLAGCKDDHFAIDETSASGKATIWEQIKDTQYGKLLQQVKVSKNEKEQTEQTYAQLLNSDETFTLFVPETFDYEACVKLIEEGNQYKVENELIRNNMTRYANLINKTDSVKISLYNGKYAWINYDKNTIRGIAFNPAKENIPASNGVLHYMSEPIPYQANLSDYIYSTPGLDSLAAFYKKFQTFELDEINSTAGKPKDGQVTWVDSVNVIRNSFLESYLDASIAKEDSNYVMVLPTNKTWQENVEKYKSYFKFKEAYIQDAYAQTEEGKDTILEGELKTFTQLELDTLPRYYSERNIAANLAFNANWQYDRHPITTIADVVKADSLVNTNMKKFKHLGTLNATNLANVVEADFSDMFGGKDPVALSNGAAYVVDELKFPFNTFAMNCFYDAQEYFEHIETKSTLGEKLTATITVNDSLLGESYTQKYNCFRFRGVKDTSAPTAYFKLPNILSCKYDIYVICTWNIFEDKPNYFQASLIYDNEKVYPAANKNVCRTEEKLENTNEADTLFHGTKNFINRAPRRGEDGKLMLTDTICLAKDFEFPVSCYGISTSYAVLKLSSTMTSSIRKSKLYTQDFYVNRILLKPKEN